MKLLKFLLPLLVFGGITVAKAQTADEIINKYIEAIGGKDKLSQVKSVYLEGTANVNGNDNPYSISILNGKGFKYEAEFNGQKFVQVYTDSSGWAINPFAGGSGAEAMPDDVYKAGREQIYATAQLFDYAAKGNKVELEGKDGGTYKLKVTSTNGTQSIYYIDASTYYITKAVRQSEMQGQMVDLTITFSDYKKTDFGTLFPYTQQSDFGGNFSITNTVKTIQINKDIDPSIFVMGK
jgi:hypothetical protein